MNKLLKWLLIVIGTLLVSFFFIINLAKQITKKASPQDVTEYKYEDTQISITYSRPFKKGRVVFGGLVPLGEVWRTGANEATSFTTNKNLTIGGKYLFAGKYTLWTIPQKDKWTVIFNKNDYLWGVGFDGQANRQPDADALEIESPVILLNEPIEQFTILFETIHKPLIDSLNSKPSPSDKIFNILVKQVLGKNDSYMTLQEQINEILKHHGLAGGRPNDPLAKMSSKAVKGAWSFSLDADLLKNSDGKPYSPNQKRAIKELSRKIDMDFSEQITGNVEGYYNLPEGENNTQAKFDKETQLVLVFTWDNVKISVPINE